MNKSFILAFFALVIVVHGAVLPFDNDTVNKIFQDKLAGLVLLTSADEASTAAKAALTELDETAPQGIILTNSDSADGLGIYDRLLEYLGVQTTDVPKFVFLAGNANGEKYLFTGQTANKDTLTEFIKQVQAGEVKQFLKSAAVPETNDDAVKIIVGSTFEEWVTKSQKEVLVKFYAPWCGHCQHLAPQYEKAAKRIANNPNIVIAKVDSTQNEVSGMNIQGYPTLKFFGKDKTATPIDFDGARDADGIVSWLKDHTEYDWVEPVVEQPAVEQTAEQAASQL